MANKQHSNGRAVQHGSDSALDPRSKLNKREEEAVSLGADGAKHVW